MPFDFDVGWPYEDFTLFGNGAPGPKQHEDFNEDGDFIFDFELDADPEDMFPALAQATQPSHISMPDRARLSSIRKSTPDSEALASSDDETNDLPNIATNTAADKGSYRYNGRRTSWLDQIRSGPPRRASNASNTSPSLLSPNEQMAPLGRTISNQSYGTSKSSSPLQTWSRSQEQRNMPPFTATPFNSVEDTYSPLTGARNPSVPVPFTFPLQPTPKTHRSLSYSVGQMEDGIVPESTGQTVSRDRQYAPGYQPPPRQVRYNTLDQLNERDNTFAHEEEQVNVGSANNFTNGGSSVSFVSPNRSFGEDGRIRQAVSPVQQKTTTFDPFTQTHGLTHLIQPSSSHPHSGDDAFKDRSSLGAEAMHRPTDNELADIANSHNENVQRRSQWQTSLDFGPLPDIPQSRRHSMADLPTRRNSLAAAAANDQAVFSPATAAGPSLTVASPLSSGEPAAQSPMQSRDEQGLGFAAGYFSGHGPAARSRFEMGQMAASSPPQGNHYSSGPPQGVFQRPGPDTDRLVLVSFKCARTEVYYLAENTGLVVKVGDLVVVEADRGYDLGTVLRLGLTWNEARFRKDEANATHLHWLTMFSQHNQVSGGLPGTNAGMMANAQYSTTPLTLAIEQQAGSQAQNNYMAFSPPGNNMMQQQNPGAADNAQSADLRPRLIKRLAQPHEVSSLRDKEGSEAKAKRICQQKVTEHKLDMEILDAEFQVDWKKLTFFYYANKYINFNILVTDLFKIYKTRIWMSAVNPASLNVPLAISRSIGPGAVEGRSSPFDPRHTMVRQFDGNSPATSPFAGPSSTAAMTSPSFNAYAMTPRNPGFLVTSPALASSYGFGPHQYHPASGHAASSSLSGLAQTPRAAGQSQHNVGPIARPSFSSFMPQNVP